jgi:hypothetical protein
MKPSQKLLALAGIVLALGAAMPAATAFAKDGADNPPGDVKGGGADDGPNHQ